MVEEENMTVKESITLWSQRLIDYERSNMPKAAIKACEKRLEILEAYYKAREELERQWNKRKEGVNLLKQGDLDYN